MSMYAQGESNARASNSTMSTIILLMSLTILSALGQDWTFDVCKTKILDVSAIPQANLAMTASKETSEKSRNCSLRITNILKDWQILIFRKRDKSTASLYWSSLNETGKIALNEDFIIPMSGHSQYHIDLTLVSEVEIKMTYAWKMSYVERASYNVASLVSLSLSPWGSSYSLYLRGRSTTFITFKFCVRYEVNLYVVQYVTGSSLSGVQLLITNNALPFSTKPASNHGFIVSHQGLNNRTLESNGTLQLTGFNLNDTIAIQRIRNYWSSGQSLVVRNGESSYFEFEATGVFVVHYINAVMSYINITLSQSLGKSNYGFLLEYKVISYGCKGDKLSNVQFESMANDSFYIKTCLEGLVLENGETSETVKCVAGHWSQWSTCKPPPSSEKINRNKTQSYTNDTTVIGQRDTLSSMSDTHSVAVLAASILASAIVMFTAGLLTGAKLRRKGACRKSTVDKNRMRNSVLENQSSITETARDCKNNSNNAQIIQHTTETIQSKGGTLDTYEYIDDKGIARDGDMERTRMSHRSIMN